MSNHSDIAQREFDWYATDRFGCFALFATAGEGPIHALVLREHQAHDGVSASIPSGQWGSDKVWDSYAALGFYVYDSNYSDGYLRRRIPSAEMAQELKTRLASISSILRMGIDFQNHDVIAPGLIEGI